MTVTILPSVSKALPGEGLPRKWEDSGDGPIKVFAERCEDSRLNQDNVSIRLFSHFCKNTSCYLHIWRQYCHLLEYMPSLVSRPSISRLPWLPFWFWRVSSCRSTSGVCQHSFRNPGAGKLRICLEVIRTLKTIVVFGMFSGQGSTQGNALSGEPRITSNYYENLNHQQKPLVLSYWKA